MFFFLFRLYFTLEKDNFADLAHFHHLVLEMGQVLDFELISPGISETPQLSLLKTLLKL